jgi:hypothetical protein
MQGEQALIVLPVVIAATRCSRLSSPRSRTTSVGLSSRWTRRLRLVRSSLFFRLRGGYRATKLAKADSSWHLTDIIKAELEEKQFKVKLTVIDTPGFGDYVNNRDSWMPIVDFIVR